MQPNYLDTIMSNKPLVKYLVLLFISYVVINYLFYKVGSLNNYKMFYSKSDKDIKSSNQIILKTLIVFFMMCIGCIILNNPERSFKVSNQLIFRLVLTILMIIAGSLFFNFVVLRFI